MRVFVAACALVATLVPLSPAAAHTAAVMCAGEIATIVGTDGDDVLVGTAGRDVIHGRRGRDVIRGLQGDDVICGGGGRDRVRGGPGDDTIWAGASVDFVRGGPGFDVLAGGTQGDRLRGGPRSDLIRGGPGLDKVRGGGGADLCVSAAAVSCGEAPTADTNTLMPGESLLAGHRLVSRDAGTRLRVAADGNVAIWQGNIDLWDSDTSGRPGARLRMSAAGALEVVWRGNVVWTSSTASPGSRAVLRNDANLVVTRPGGQSAWDRRSNPGIPDWHLPFPIGESWEAGAPHGENLSALDFGPHDSSSDVVAVASGTVGWYECENGGRYLKIEHGDGFMSTYYHLVDIRTELVGTWVEAGTVVGQAGNGLPCGGRSTFAHVHLTLWRDDVRLSADGLMIRGYTVHAGAEPYYGHWTDNETGETILVNSGGAVCCLPNHG